MGGLQAEAGNVLTEPQVDNNQTSRGMLEPAMARWFKELSGGSGNGIIYKRWQWHAVSGNRWKEQPAFNEHDDQPERRKLEELKGLEWGPIHDAAIRLGKVSDFAGGEVDREIRQIGTMVSAAWPDKNGQHAVEKINAMSTTTKNFSDVTKQLGTHLMGFVNETKKVIQGLVDFANSKEGYFGGYLGNDEHVDIAHFSHAIDAIDLRLRVGKEMGGQPFNLDVARSSTPGLKIRDDWGWWYNDVEKGRLDRFCDEYFNNVGALRRMINEAHSAVEKHLTQFTSASSGLAFTPYANLEALGNAGTQEEKPQDPPPEKKKEDGGTGGTGTKSGDSSGSTGNGSSSTPPPPPPYQPPPLSSDMGTTDPATGTTPGSADVPGADDPTTGTPDPGTGRPNETVTIEDGNRKVSVGAPDSEGNVKVTVDDGTGQPKTYDLDFGAGTGQQPGTTPGQLGPDGQPLPAPASQFGPTGQQPPATGQLGPDGQPIMTADGSQQVQAGPDGKVVLQDGDVKITAEHPPGQPGQVKLTIDDGTPTTYLIDYSDPANPKVEEVPATATTQGFAGPGQASSFAAQPGNVASAPAGFTEPVDTGFAAQPATGFSEPAAAGYGAHAAVEPVDSGFAGDSGGAHAAPEQPSLTTSTQSVGFDFEGGNGDAGFADTTWSTQGDLLDDSGQQVAPAAGEAGLAAVPDGGSPAPQQGQGAAPMGGGGMMGGGMMGAGAGGGQGGDSERSGGQWSIQGDLFSDEPAAARIAGVLDDEPGFDR
jgi:hypothetical protein